MKTIPVCRPSRGFFYWIDKYTLVQTNVNNNETEIEIIQSQTKNKTSLPNKGKDELQADIYLTKTSHQLAFKLLCREYEIYRS